MIATVVRFALAVLVVACGPYARMYVPPELANVSDRYDASGHVVFFWKTVRFGPYRADDGRKGARKEEYSSPSIFNGNVEETRFRLEVRFTFSAPNGERFAAECRRDRHELIKHHKSLGGNIFS